MRYEGIDFNEDWVRSMAEEAFVNAPLNRVHWIEAPNTVPIEQRKKRLRELWQLLNPNKKANADNQQFVAGGRENIY